jgi:hypothetical protein
MRIAQKVTSHLGIPDTMSIARSLLLILPLTFASLAHAAVYKCIDADGRVTYTNDRTLARDCTPLTTDLPVSSVPAPQPRSPAAQPPGATPAPGFPRVTPDAQRARDDTRRQILESELAAEEEALKEAQAALTEQESIRLGSERNYQRVLDRLQPFKDKVELHERNLEALRRELRGLR